LLWDYVKCEQGNPKFDRLYAELCYLSALSDSLGGKFDKLLKDAVNPMEEIFPRQILCFAMSRAARLFRHSSAQ
jgi:hypothetical protein